VAGDDHRELFRQRPQLGPGLVIKLFPSDILGDNWIGPVGALLPVIGDLSYIGSLVRPVRSPGIALFAIPRTALFAIPRTARSAVESAPTPTRTRSGPIVAAVAVGSLVAEAVTLPAATGAAALRLVARPVTLAAPG
jgi:hypothetical protein